MVRGSFRAGLLRIDRVLFTGDDEVVYPVLDVGSRIRRAEEALVVGLVLGEEQGRPALAVQVIGSKLGIERGDGAGILCRRVYSQRWLRPLRPPAPDIAEPEGGQEMKRGGVRPAVAHADLDQHVGRA